ncbi:MULTISPECIES: hypothetical protein [unclassified Bacillus (in: firmicutes)]|uniref:hypothetical protein n=1 Tax=Bacillaceae TaxID=186817 RepID=UPI000BEFC0A1|nr:MULTISPECIES: hypothetical protein [unclassified Bacillus (in: firmicutes)]PEJ56479.1 hypothetical protein CN692_17265 [Bacillus sp. AFS002410]PEL08034.1 hypothetical protein CN601_18575 [Bacillus sp. AFS017336]QKE74713.1 hypothetical protein HPK19_19015 [Arthrobacter citreus]
MKQTDHEIVETYTQYSGIAFFIGLILFLLYFTGSGFLHTGVSLTVSIVLMGSCSTLFLLGTFLGLMFSISSKEQA